MIDLTLTEEQRMIQKTARDFAEREVRPVVDRINAREHADAESTWQLLQPVYKKAAELGFFSFFIPEAFGGSGRSGIDGAIFSEEIAAVDIGVAMTMSATMGYPRFILAVGTEEQKKRLIPQFCRGEVHILAGAQSEPGVAGSDLFYNGEEPKAGIQTFARREGEEYVINGGKSAFVTNAGIARSYFIVCRTGRGPLSENLSMFYVPADAAGLSTGPRTRMIGMKTAFHAELFLDDVRVPADNLLGGEGKALALLSAVLGQGLGAQFVGLARATYEYALAYASERKSWGKPIREHQAVALMLADMEMEVQAARLLCWDSLLAAERRDPKARIKGMASKTYAVDIAMKTAQNAVKILGGYGVTEEYKAAQYLCDAMMGYSCDFTGDVLRLLIAEQL